MQPLIQESLTAIDRLDDVLETDTEYFDENNKKYIDFSDINITIKNLSFSYGYNNTALNNINLNIKNGEKVIIVGESGSGKSTLAKLLAGFQKISEGDIYFNKENINSISLKCLRNQVTYIPQESFLFSGTIKDNIIGDNHINKNKLNKIILGCHIDSILNNMPSDLDNIISENGENLSGGERQRIAIARALVNDSSIYIFDESTNQLDKKLESDIMEFIWSTLDNKICISIMHNLNLVEKADKIIVMDNKTIVGIGTHEELLSSNEIYASLINKNIEEVY